MVERSRSSANVCFERLLLDSSDTEIDEDGWSKQVIKFFSLKIHT